MPLQATLLELARVAAQQLAAERIHPDAAAGLTLDLAVLFDPAMHGNVATPDLAGIDPRSRAVLVMEGNRSATVLDPTCSAEVLLERAPRQGPGAGPGRRVRH